LAKIERSRGHTIPWPRQKGLKDTQYLGQDRKVKRTHNTLAKTERTKGHTIPWPRKKDQKDKQYLGKERKD
jgi:hypothetical protein